MMNVNIILCTFLSIVSRQFLAVAQTPDPCVKVGWSGYYNTAVVKEGQLLSSVSELSKCKQACIDDTTCAGFDFNYIDNRCWTFSVSCNTSERETRNDSLHYDINRCLTGPTDCLLTDGGTEYLGTLSVTESGFSCALWGDLFGDDLTRLSQIVFAFPDGDWLDANNYCRNFDGVASKPWCYTTQSPKGWDYCSIPYCGPTTCKNTELGKEYVGKLAVTMSGRTCQMWASNSPQDHTFHGALFPDGTDVEALNYCRNPGTAPGGPWCFTTDPDVSWEYCDVPFCSSSNKTSTMP